MPKPATPSPSAKPLIKVLSRSTLKLLAGEGPFHRGEEYFRDRLVQSLAVDGNFATATVQGTHRYRCKL